MPLLVLLLPQFNWTDVKWGHCRAGLFGSKCGLAVNSPRWVAGSVRNVKTYWWNVTITLLARNLKHNYVNIALTQTSLRSISSPLHHAE